ncbi:MAG: sigma-70 family RNA polymerase sigma factor [Planctomycetes bacterium]|nr:sigma-70 family RNA polymerase sigma factor [Planctomycetota bacterium]
MGADPSADAQVPACAGGLDEDALERVRALLREGVVHGCVAERDLEALTASRADAEPDLDFDRRLRCVLEDLAVAVEPRPRGEDLAPASCRELTAWEEDEVDEALAFLMLLEPPVETAIAAYRREIRALPALTANERAALHAEVDAGNALAFAAIALSPAATEEVLRGIDVLESGRRKLRKVVMCSGDDDEGAHLRELQRQATVVRAFQSKLSSCGDPSVQDYSVRKIASILSGCGFTPQYLNEVCANLDAGGNAEDVAPTVLAGLRRSNAARQALVAANLRLVVWWAGQYTGRGVESVDLVGAGTLGLIRALDRFQPGREATLSTYASWWIKQSILRAIPEQNRLIRLSTNALDVRRRMRDHQRVVENESGRRPSIDATARAAGVNPTLARILSEDREILSLDSDPDGALLERAVEVSTDGLPEARAISAELQECLDGCMSTMDDRFRAVLRERFGLGGGRCRTLEDLGRARRVSRERVRQLQFKALVRLRHSTRARRLAAFLGEVELPAPHRPRVNGATNPETNGLTVVKTLLDAAPVGARDESAGVGVSPGSGSSPRGALGRPGLHPQKTLLPCPSSAPGRVARSNARAPARGVAQPAP